MGVFRVPVELRNWQNRFLREDERGEDVECEALVDSSAIELSLPAEMIRKLRLEHVGEIRVYTADGNRPTYRVFGIVDLTVQGRSCQVRAIELPQATEPLLGAIPLEEMDWHISPQERKLLPDPKSPEGPLLPLC
ncbi:MAG: pepsin/retropepsin-like aspartic protease family protein [Planctomycetota bacterium]|jgi:clan AA aspartic protease